MTTTTPDLHDIEEPTAPVRRRRPSLESPLVAIAVLTVLAFAVVGVHVARYSNLSLFDEMVHGDYAERLTRGHLVFAGNLVDQPMLQEAACRGWDVGEVDVCGNVALDAIVFPEAGENNAYAHPPLYYAVQGFGAKVLQLLPGDQSFLGPARFVGALWLAGGLVTLWFALGLLGVVRPWFRLAMAASPAVMPTVFHAAATVNPDGSGLLVGSLALLGTLRYLLGGSTWWLVAPAALAALTKITNGAAIGIAALVLLVSLLPGRRLSPERRRRDALGAAVLLVTFAALTGAWMVVQDLRNAVDPRTLSLVRLSQVPSVGMAEVMANLTALLPTVKAPYIPPVFASAWWDGWNQLLVLVLGAAPVVAFLAAPGDQRRLRTFGWATVLVLLVMSPFLVITTHLMTGTYFPIVSRYGLATVPLLVAMLAAAAGHRAARAGLVGLFGVGAAIYVGTVGLAL